jgi:UDP-N-acetyl-D-galactosamine dehydrogenase
MERKIGVIGLGYVGLPVAVAFARKYNNVVGFDINKAKVAELLAGHDRTGEVDDADLQAVSLKITADPEELRDVDFFVVAVPTPVDKAHRPDLTLVVKASEIVGQVMKRGAIIVYESTVYPGVTEEICGPVLARASGLTQGIEFKLGYSPERINPGDKEHTLGNIVKVVSGEDEQTRDIIAGVYGAIIPAGVHRAPSIKVAEAAKVIENTQRDLNIALMNELAMLFDRMRIRTIDVLEAAGTKWNFLPFRPGLVGGHCIGVDPYYLTSKAEELGYQPQVILAGRRINDGMGKYIAEQTVKHLVRAGGNVCEARVGILGLTFKENVPDLRNSRVPDIVTELKDYGIDVLVHDPIGDKEEAREEYRLELCELDDLNQLEAIILAVAHNQYATLDPGALISKLKNGKGAIIDVKSFFNPRDFPPNIQYWSL